MRHRTAHLTLTPSSQGRAIDTLLQVLAKLREGRGPCPLHEVEELLAERLALCVFKTSALRLRANRLTDLRSNGCKIQLHAVLWWSKLGFRC